MNSKLLILILACAVVTPQAALAARGRPVLNAARSTFVGDNGRLLRGPYTSSEWGDPAPSNNIANMRNLGFNAVHLYGEVFDLNYPNPGSTAPGYAAARIDSVVQATRNLGMYLVITIGNGANNGNYNYRYATDFWRFYAPRYANETHVIYEIHNEPVAWGPPYSSPNATPPGAVTMEVDCYNIIRQYAPNTPVLLFSYAVLGGTGGSDAALTDVRAFNQSVFGNQNATWNNIAVGFHGYAGAGGTELAVSNIIRAGYPCFMTEFIGGIWSSNRGGLDVELTSALERLGVSWNAFLFVPPWGVSDDVTRPDAYTERVVNSGLSWIPDYGTFPVNRSVFGNGGVPRATPDYVNNTLSGSLRIQAEDFDNGAKNVAYFNNNSSNPGGQYRTSQTVGIETTADAGGGYNVGWIAAGDWLEYTIRVPAAGTYDLRLRVAGTSAGRVRVLARGVDLTGDWTLPTTGGWQTWTTATRSVLLGAGQQKLRVSVLGAGFNLNWIELSPAPSGPIPNGTYTFRNAGNALALDVNANNTVITAPSSGSINQQWNLQHIGGGQYRVASAGNGWTWDTWAGPLHLTSWWGTGGDRCFIIVPASGGNYRVIQAGGGLSLEPTTQNPPVMEFDVWNGTAAQQWTIGTATSFPGVAFYQNLNYGGAAGQTLQAGTYTTAQLAASGVPNDWASSARIPAGWTVIVYASDNFSGTSWTLTADTPNFGSLSPSANDQMSSCVIRIGGTYRLIARHSGKALDANGAATTNGTQIIQWTYGGGNNQRWTVTDRGNGQYSIIGVQSGKCIEVSNWGTANGTKVHLWDWLNGTNQRFTFTSTGSGYYRITPTHATGSCLDVSGVSTADGATVQLWQWLSGNNQQWALQTP